MRRSQLFTKTQKQAPADEVSKNAQLLLRAGYISKQMAGAYEFMPLGLRVLNNIIEIIRQEMNAIGGQEILMTGLQKPDNWQASGRWSDEVVDVWFKTKLASGAEIGLANTHEEALTSTLRQFINSYKDLPVYPYQFQTKFRNELRAKSGIMRGREFIMKDLYSFSIDKDQHNEFYELITQSYLNIFERLGIGESTFLTFASGGSFAKYSHEFQTICDAGEDEIYLDRSRKLAVNKEVYNDEVLTDLKLDKTKLEKVKAAEVGNIFTLDTKFSKDLGLNFTTKQGGQQPVFMGSYGIGPGRTMGVITELLADEKGLVWPEGIAPYDMYLIRVGDDHDMVRQADKLYDDLIKLGKAVLYDDRNEGVGKMLADAELMGIPTRVLISEKSLGAGGLEVRQRTEADSKVIGIDEFLNKL